MYQHSVQLFAKFRKRDKYSQGYSKKRRKARLKALLYLQICIIDRQEQYSCRNCLLLHGIEEKSNGNTGQRVINALSESMGKIISIQNIDRAHRLPRKKPNGKSRLVIVKFVCYNTRNLIYKNEKVKILRPKE